MLRKDSPLNNVDYDYDYDVNAIPENLADDTLRNIDDKSMRDQRKARFSQDTRFRKHLANWVMAIVPCWLLLVVIILFLEGFDLLHLHTEVMITLLATTTINVLGLAYIVLKGIFPESK